MRLPRVGVDATPGTVQYGRLRRKVIVAVAVDHDSTAANGSGAIGRDAGSEAVDVSPDVAPAAGPRPAAAKSGKVRQLSHTVDRTCVRVHMYGRRFEKAGGGEMPYTYRGKAAQVLQLFLCVAAVRQ